MRNLYYWAWCLSYDTRPNRRGEQGRPTKLIQGPYSCDGEGLGKLNSDINRIYPQGKWEVEELPTVDRAKAVAVLRHKIAYAEGNLDLAMRKFYSKPREPRKEVTADATDNRDFYGHRP